MAARNTDISLTTGAAVLLTDGAVSACRVENKSGYTITPHGHGHQAAQVVG